MFCIKDFRLSLLQNEKSFELSIDSFFLKRGEIAFIYGESGSGKSTLFNLLTGIIESKISRDMRIYFPRIEYIMHDSKLLPWITLGNNVKIINKFGGKIQIDSLLSICEQLGLSDEILRLHSWQLSMGMRQRFEIAIALSNQPDLIILDEALSGIDIKNRIVACGLLSSFANIKNATLLLTAHHLSDMLRLAERVIHIANGKIGDNTIISSTTIDQRLCMSLSDLFLMPEAALFDNMSPLTHGAPGDHNYRLLHKLY